MINGRVEGSGLRFMYWTGVWFFALGEVVMTPRIVLTLLTALTLSTGTAIAQSDCFIAGDIEGMPNLEHPGMGAWRYELTVVWDTSVPQAVSHINLIVDDGSNCECGDFTGAINLFAVCGTSNDDPEPCSVVYYHEFNCNGDPSLDIDDPLYKFEYDEDLGCEPANVGTAVFEFFSDYEPYATELPNLLVVDKHGRLSCSGELTGVFPALPCGPVADERMTWGAVKSGYGD